MCNSSGIFILSKLFNLIWTIWSSDIPTLGQPGAKEIENTVRTKKQAKRKNNITEQEAINILYPNEYKLVDKNFIY